MILSETGPPPINSGAGLSFNHALVPIPKVGSDSRTYVRTEASNLPHDAGDTARLSIRTGDVALEVADRGLPEIARPHIGPGSARFVAFTMSLAALAAGIRRQLELPIIAARPVDGEFDRTAVRLDDAGTAHARHAAGRRDARRDPRFEPADGVRALGRRIGERPGATARIAFAARRALGGIARA